METQHHGERALMFRSRIDGERLFSTHNEARRHDRELARRIVAHVSSTDFEAAFKTRNDRLAKALKFLAEETDLFAMELAESC
jgi:hypothetical protein